MKICIIIGDITQKAGTERAVSSLCNGLLKYFPSDYEITIISVFSNFEDKPFYPLNSKVKITHLNKPFQYNSLTKIFWYFDLIQKVEKINKKEKFDYVLGTVYVFNVLLSLITRGSQTKTIACEHEIYEYPSKFAQIVRNQVYAKFDKVVLLTQAEKNKFSFLKNAVIIPNSLPFVSNKKSNGTAKQIIAVGRLTYQKGFDILIEIMKKVHQQAPDWKLNIYGEGDDFNALQYQVEAEELTHIVHLKGSTQNIADKYAENSIFVLTSRWESFGLVILEAMNSGLPVVSFDCDGPKSIIKDCENGFLVPRFNTDEFANQMLQLINNTEKRQKMSKKAIKDSQNYDESHIISMWDNLFRN